MRAVLDSPLALRPCLTPAAECAALAAEFLAVVEADRLGPAAWAVAHRTAEALALLADLCRALPGDRRGSAVLDAARGIHDEAMERIHELHQHAAWMWSPEARGDAASAREREAGL